MFKRERCRKSVCILLSGVLLLAGGLTGSIYAAETEVLEESSETGSGIRVVDVTIVSLVGNQMTFQIDQVVGEEEETASETSAAEADEGEEMEMPSMPQQSGEDGDGGEAPSGEMPSMPQQSGEDGDGGEMPQRVGGSKEGNSGPNDEADLTETVYIPVSAPVLSTTGEQVSYTILQAGDSLEITFETDENGNEIITQIQILEVSDSSSSTTSGGRSSGFGGMMQGGGMQMPGGSSSGGGMQMPSGGGMGGGPNGG